MGGTPFALLSFRDLGPLEVLRAGVPVALGGARLTAALSLLLVHAGRHVSVDALGEAMWGGNSPARSSSTLDSHVWRLRKALEPDRAPGAPSEVLVREPGGYRLTVDPETVDSRRFPRLAGEARALLSSGRADEACRAAEEALALWRGRPWPAVADAPWAAADVARLAELRDQAREVLAEALLTTGAPGRALLELGPSLAETPLRERLWALRMLAQHRLGRPEEALRSYRQARAVFLDELGIEPGPDLRELQRRILAEDPTLAGAAAPPSPPPPAPPSPPGPATGSREVPAVEGTGTVTGRPDARPGRLPGGGPGRGSAAPGGPLHRPGEDDGGPGAGGGDPSARRGHLLGRHPLPPPGLPAADQQRHRRRAPQAHRDRADAPAHGRRLPRALDGRDPRARRQGHEGDSPGDVGPPGRGVVAGDAPDGAVVGPPEPRDHHQAEQEGAEPPGLVPEAVGQERVARVPEDGGRRQHRQGEDDGHDGHDGVEDGDEPVETRPRGHGRRPGPDDAAVPVPRAVPLPPRRDASRTMGRRGGRDLTRPGARPPPAGSRPRWW